MIELKPKAKKSKEKKENEGKKEEMDKQPKDYLSKKEKEEFIASIEPKEIRWGCKQCFVGFLFILFFTNWAFTCRYIHDPYEYEACVDYKNFITSKHDLRPFLKFMYPLFLIFILTTHLMIDYIQACDNYIFLES